MGEENESKVPLDHERVDVNRLLSKEELAASDAAHDELLALVNSSQKAKASYELHLSALLNGRDGLLAGLRKECNVTQTELADRMGMTQSEVSKLEHRDDLLISTLNRYVTSLGCVLRVYAAGHGFEYQLPYGNSAGQVLVTTNYDTLITKAVSSNQYDPALSIDLMQLFQQGASLYEPPQIEQETSEQGVAA